LEIRESNGLLRSLAVAERHREIGLGASLTTEIETYACACGIETLYLLTTTAETFFLNQGFHVIDRIDVPASIRTTEEFKSICPSIAICMMKRI